MTKTRRSNPEDLVTLADTYHNAKIIRNAEFLGDQDLINLENSGVYIPPPEQIPISQKLYYDGMNSGLASARYDSERVYEF